MVSFQTIVVVIAIILLIICLIFIGMALEKNESMEQWPPIVGECPDYWIDTSGNGANCVNTRKLGTCKTGGNGVSPSNSIMAMNFTVAPYTGSNSTCAKYNWANKCDITWDGITSGISNPCIKSSS